MNATAGDVPSATPLLNVTDPPIGVVPSGVADGDTALGPPDGLLETGPDTAQPETAIVPIRAIAAMSFMLISLLSCSGSCNMGKVCDQGQKVDGVVQFASINLGIDLRCREVRVAQQLLNHT